MAFQEAVMAFQEAVVAMNPVGIALTLVGALVGLLGSTLSFVEVLALRFLVVGGIAYCVKERRAIVLQPISEHTNKSKSKSKSKSEDPEAECEKKEHEQGGLIKHCHHTVDEENDCPVTPVLDAIRNRRSVFPKQYIDREIPSAVVQSMLDAAAWAPYHGPRPPWRFVVLGKQAMVEMQQLTLKFYDKNWAQTGWANGKKGTAEEYLRWREMTEQEITGRWGPCSYMIANVMRRQAGSKRLPEWEEAAATACAVHNMHIQACSFPGVACYWSSWHDAARDSAEMASFLGLEDKEDKVLGFLVIAAYAPDLLTDKDRRVRGRSHTMAEWRV
ncbi:nitroreductase domain-containing protein [Pseudoscourfieldia marina]